MTEARTYSFLPFQLQGTEVFKLLLQNNIADFQLSSWNSSLRSLNLSGKDYHLYSSRVCFLFSALLLTESILKYFKVDNWSLRTPLYLCWHKYTVCTLDYKIYQQDQTCKIQIYVLFDGSLHSELHDFMWVFPIY